MKGQIDPRLSAQLDDAGDDGEVEAVLTLTDQAHASGGAANSNAVPPVVDRVSKETQQDPTSVRFMPRLGVLYVKGSGKLVRQLLEQDEVATATANEADITIPEVTRDPG
jgi:hypothetical protein